MREINISEAHIDVSQEEKKTRKLGKSSNKKHAILTGLNKSWIRLGIKWTILKILGRCYNNPLDWIRGLKYLAKLRQSVLGDHRIKKLVKVNNLYFTDLYIPAWNDISFDQFIASELNRFKTHSQPVNRLNQVFLAITKKCPMRCEHCSAWDTLNMKDSLVVDDFDQILRDVDSIGFSQLYFTGGEPLVKFQLLESLISRLPRHLKSWIATSGFQLTRDKSRRLKKAGLTGVFVSLDHYDEELHNAFRNHKDAYYWALIAAKNALEAGLVVAFSVCLNDDLCSREELLGYMKLAKETGVHFVQFLEPQSVGHFKDKNVVLSEESIETAESLYLEMNFGKDYLEYPLIHYLGYYHRRVGCFSSGKQVIYIDADGNLNACPFCLANYGNLLEGRLLDKVDDMAQKGCELFNIKENAPTE